MPLGALRLKHGLSSGQCRRTTGKHLRDAIHVYKPDRNTRCYFPSLEHFQAILLNVLFHGRYPVDVTERHAQRVRVRRKQADKGPTVTESCAALAHAMRELVSYYPQNMRPPPAELLMAKVKAKLPASVTTQLDNAEFLLKRNSSLTRSSMRPLTAVSYTHLTLPTKA